VALVCIALLAAPALDAGGIDVRGTFTNLRYSRESGDLLGAEIKIVPVTLRDGGPGQHEPTFQGALQIAEGEPSEIMVVRIRLDGSKISFEIPKPYPLYGGGTFAGSVEGTVIVGRFTFRGAVGDEVRLRRGRGYWEP
jgi:hypothetical protein